jgi:hypothetical protein
MLRAKIMMLAVITGGQLAPSVPGKRVPIGPQDMRQLSLDELIDRLPRVGFESIYDADRGFYVDDPSSAELQRRLEASVAMTDEQWQSALLRTGSLRCRPVWPVELRFAVMMRSPRWLGPAVVTAVPRIPGWPTATAGALVPVTCANCASGRERRESYQELGSLPLGESDVVFDVSVERGDSAHQPNAGPGPFPPPGIVWRGPLHLRVTVVEDPDLAFHPVHNEALDEAIRRGLRLGHSSKGGPAAPELTTVLSFKVDTKTEPSLATMAISLQVDVIRAGKLVNTYATASVRPPRTRSGILFCSIDLPCVPGRSLVNPALLDDFEVRVRGVRADVERLWDAESYWNGSLQFKLSDLARDEDK